jgi:multiple sugar transport system substrate-binding protein
MRDIYQRGMSPEVFAWTAASNNQAYIAGRLSLALNAISIARSLENANSPLTDVTWIAPTPRGPVRRMGFEHVMGVYVIWKFSKNQKGAKKYLIDQQLNYDEHFKNSGFYNFPAWPNGVRGGLKAIRKITATDTHKPKGKYTILSTIAERYTTNVGFPGFANAGIDEVFNKFLIPQMFAQVAQGKLSPEDSAKAADNQIKDIFAKWRKLKKI